MGAVCPLLPVLTFLPVQTTVALSMGALNLVPSPLLQVLTSLPAPTIAAFSMGAIEFLVAETCHLLAIFESHLSSTKSNRGYEPSAQPPPHTQQPPPSSTQPTPSITTYGKYTQPYSYPDQQQSHSPLNCEDGGMDYGSNDYGTNNNGNDLNMSGPVTDLNSPRVTQTAFGSWVFTFVVLVNVNTISPDVNDSDIATCGLRGKGEEVKEGPI
ncbi:hypothetical protein DEU56DRAFT_762279 [Suillus clintonianus]|uniref:uncharacterized protein n=1 Tax=Suillus clintonianus TaxID=1904413 RepID=UPI001B880EE0|nr:uncharacterized protein DEU56DRAFT_762279 [Suillus clintonianus]KAG2110787.1 hypothetical protein DEU56DRAFT_762279 [Suillus clintonianus]